MFGALTHRLQTKMLVLSRRALLRARVEAATIVGNREGDLAVGVRDADIDATGMSVVNGVGDRFLRDAEQLQVHVGGRVVGPASGDVDGGADTVSRLGVGRELGQRLGETWRAQGMASQFED